ARASVKHDRHVAAQFWTSLQLFEGGTQYVVRAGVLAADVDEDALRLDRMSGDEAALDEPEGDPRHDLVVLEAAGLRLVRVDDEVVRIRVLIRLRDEGPLPSGREEGAAAASELGCNDFVDHGVR